jgi:hypothetical protein
VLSREPGISPRTVAKGRTRATVADMKTGPTEPRSTVLTEAEAAMIVAFRRHTLLPLGDCLSEPPQFCWRPLGPCHATISGVIRFA